MDAMLERLALDMPCRLAAAIPGNMDDMLPAAAAAIAEECCCCCCWRSEDMIVMARRSGGGAKCQISSLLWSQDTG